MNASNRVRIATAVLSVVIAALLMGAVDRNAAKSVATPAPVAQSQVAVPLIGVATGEFQNGVPVYRLPAVTVTETRSQALARFAREDAVAMK
ncbi:MAG: hypothetical protein ABI593_17430 [Betaproteobacteria bacterium]